MIKNNAPFTTFSCTILLVFSMVLGVTAQNPSKGDFPIGSYIDGDFIATFTSDGKLIVHTDDFIKAEAVYKVEGE